MHPLWALLQAIVPPYCFSHFCHQAIMGDLGKHGTMIDTGHPGLEAVSVVVGSSGLHCLERTKGQESEN